MSRVKRALARRYARALAPYEKSFATTYRATMRAMREDSSRVPTKAQTKKWKGRTLDALRPVYHSAIVAGGRDFLTNTLSLKTKKASKPRSADIVVSLEDLFAERLQETVDTTVEALADVVDEAVADGLDASEVDDLIDEEWDDVLGDRSDTIALVEMNGAFGAVRDYLMRELVELQAWVNAQDARVRVTHAIYGEAGKKPVGFDWATLIDDAGYTLRYPCDPHCDEPGEVVNCRCFTVPEGELEFAPEELASYLDDFDMDPEDVMLSEEQTIERGFRVKGDYEGHPFRGNQWTSGYAQAASDESRESDLAGQQGIDLASAHLTVAEAAHTSLSQARYEAGKEFQRLEAIYSQEESENQALKSKLEDDPGDADLSREQSIQQGIRDAAKVAYDDARTAMLKANTLEQEQAIAVSRLRRDLEEAQTHYDLSNSTSPVPDATALPEEHRTKADLEARSALEESGVSKERYEALAKQELALKDDPRIKAAADKSIEAQVAYAKAQGESQRAKNRVYEQQAIIERDSQLRATEDFFERNPQFKVSEENTLAMDKSVTDAKAEVNAARLALRDVQTARDNAVAAGMLDAKHEVQEPDASVVRAAHDRLDAAQDVLREKTNDFHTYNRLKDAAGGDPYHRASSEWQAINRRPGTHEDLVRYSQERQGELEPLRESANVSALAADAARGDASAAENDEKGARNAVESEFAKAAGPDYYYTKASQDDDFYKATMNQVSEDWQHIGGEGPQRLRIATGIGLGLQNGAAFDSNKGRFLQPADYGDLRDDVKTMQWAGALRREYLESQRDLDSGRHERVLALGQSHMGEGSVGSQGSPENTFSGEKYDDDKAREDWLSSGAYDDAYSEAQNDAWQSHDSADRWREDLNSDETQEAVNYLGAKQLADNYTWESAGRGSDMTARQILDELKESTESERSQEILSQIQSEIGLEYRSPHQEDYEGSQLEARSAAAMYRSALEQQDVAEQYVAAIQKASGLVGRQITREEAITLLGKIEPNKYSSSFRISGPQIADAAGVRGQGLVKDELTPGMTSAWHYARDFELSDHRMTETNEEFQKLLPPRSDGSALYGNARIELAGEAMDHNYKSLADKSWSSDREKWDAIAEEDPDDVFDKPSGSYRHVDTLDEGARENFFENWTWDDDGKAYDSWFNENKSQYMTDEFSAAMADYENGEGIYAQTSEPDTEAMKSSGTGRTIKVFRGIGQDQSTYIPNFAESWSTSRSKAASFGSEKVMEWDVPHERVLVFQGATNWSTGGAGSMGESEYEVIALSDLPKWYRDSYRKQLAILEKQKSEAE